MLFRNLRGTHGRGTLVDTSQSMVESVQETATGSNLSDELCLSLVSSGSVWCSSAMSLNPLVETVLCELH